MLCNISFNVQHNIPASDEAKKIDIYTAIEWLSLAWTGVSDLSIHHPNNDSFPDPYLDFDVTDEMRGLIDIPFRDFINLEGDEIIHPVVAEPGILYAVIVPDDYQPDSTPRYRAFIAGDINNISQIRKKVAK